MQNGATPYNYFKMFDLIFSMKKLKVKPIQATFIQCRAINDLLTCVPQKKGHKGKTTISLINFKTPSPSNRVKTQLTHGSVP